MRRRRWPTERLTRSLAARLLWAVGVPLALLVVAGALLDELGARSVADAAHDRTLASLAVGLSARLETDRDGDLATHLPAMLQAVMQAQPGDRIDFAVVAPDGRVLAGDPALGALRALGGEVPVFVDLRLHGDPVRAVVHRYHGPDRDASIVVAETLHGREVQARRLVALAATGNVAVALAAALAAVLSVRVALRPLNELRRRVEHAPVDALRPLRVRGLPDEVAPLVHALNRMLRRTRRAAEARRAFVDDTAHQLRTPVAALSTLVDVLAAAPMPPDARAPMEAVRASVDRLSHLTHQMLALARADADGPVPDQAIDLPALLRDVAGDQIDAATAGGQDLGFEAAPATARGAAWWLREALDNLVDNAIRHTPPGARITVRCGPMPAGGAFVEVEDDGPGIAPERRAGVLRRHQGGGVAGSHGLGLSIVQGIARRHGASLQIGDGADGRGCRVRLSFPAPGLSAN